MKVGILEATAVITYQGCNEYIQGKPIIQHSFVEILILML